MNEQFVYIWEYKVFEKRRSQFLKIYGPGGDWVQLFNKAEGYVSTDLHQDIDDPERYVSIDIWKSKAHRDNFRIQFAREFDALDDLGEKYTAHEISLGEFNIVS